MTRSRNAVSLPPWVWLAEVGVVAVLYYVTGRLGVACVATGNVHAHHRCRAELQDAFVALAHRCTLEASEPLRRGNHSHVLCSPAAMAADRGGCLG